MRSSKSSKHLDARCRHLTSRQ